MTIWRGLVLVPLERGFVTNAWLTGWYKTHLCVACSIRVMPETEISPAMRVDYYCGELNYQVQQEKKGEVHTNPW